MTEYQMKDPKSVGKKYKLSCYIEHYRGILCLTMWMEREKFNGQK